MHTGWFLDGGKWYYFTSRGIMVYRWNKINGFWYYFDGSDGSMNKESFSYAGRTYTFYQSGAHEGALMTTKIDIDRVEQAQDSWCWAASSEMVGTYNTNSTISQFDIVYYIKGKLKLIQGTSEKKKRLYILLQEILRNAVVFHDIILCLTI